MGNRKIATVKRDRLICPSYRSQCGSMALQPALRAVQHLRALVPDVADLRMSVENPHQSGIEGSEEMGWWALYLTSVEPLIVVFFRQDDGHAVMHRCNDTVGLSGYYCKRLDPSIVGRLPCVPKPSKREQIGRAHV